VKLVIDMNLSPRWVEFLRDRGLEAEHWSALGNPRTSDREILAYAHDHDFVVFTHDLDFGDILAVTQARGPSVIQVRTQDPVPETIGDLVVAAIREHRVILNRGALVTIDPEKSRARVLPIVPGKQRDR
jgi:predicted nuclease of predicted toxin-antitoxin system